MIQLTLEGVALCFRLRRASNWNRRRPVVETVRLCLSSLILWLIRTVLENSSKDNAQYWLQEALRGREVDVKRILSPLAVGAEPEFCRCPGILTRTGSNCLHSGGRVSGCSS